MPPDGRRKNVEIVLRILRTRLWTRDQLKRILPTEGLLYFPSTLLRAG